MRRLRAGPAALELQRLPHPRGPGRRPGLQVPGRPPPRPAAGQRRRRPGRPRGRQPGQHVLRLLQGHRSQEERRPDPGGPHPGTPGCRPIWRLPLHPGLRLCRLPLLPVHAAAGALSPHLLRGPVRLLPLHRRDWPEVRGSRRPGYPDHLRAAGCHVRLRRPGGLLGRLPPGLRRSLGPQHRGHPALQQHPGRGVGPGGRHRHPRHPRRPHLLLRPVQHAALPALSHLQPPGHPLHPQHGAAPAHHSRGLLPGETVPEPELQQAAPEDCQAQPPTGPLLRLRHHPGARGHSAQTVSPPPSPLGRAPGGNQTSRRGAPIRPERLKLEPGGGGVSGNREPRPPWRDLEDARRKTRMIFRI